MKDQIGTILHWSEHKKPKQAKRKDEVIRKNLYMTHISAATLPPSNPSRHSLVSLIQKNQKIRKTKRTHINKLNNSGCQTMHLIKLKFKIFIPHHDEIIIAKFHSD